VSARFLAPKARERVREVVAEVERTTGAELVVAVRRAGGRYREADYLFGFLCALAALVALLYLPQPFAVLAFPLDVALAFIAGAASSARLPAVRRWLTRAPTRRALLRRAARAEMVELGLTGTGSRSAVLVYVGLLERDVEVVTDVGVAASGTAWDEARARLSAALRPPDLDRFVAALRALGPVLAAAVPRAADDVNEIADEAHVS
jgi:putative membrane protein